MAFAQTDHQIDNLYMHAVKETAAAAAAGKIVVSLLHVMIADDSILSKPKAFPCAKPEQYSSMRSFCP